jgi:hypothetical protein
MKAPEKVFYFEAQGGLVRETLPSVSNFFQYIPIRRRIGTSLKRG